MLLLQSFLVFYLMGVLPLASQAMAQRSLPGSSTTFPQVTVWLIAQERQPNTLEEEYRLRLGVVIPPDHHGYLDTGDDGFFLPLLFTFPLLEKQGVQLEMVAHPVGERDDIARATVLRNTGEFIFRASSRIPILSSQETVAVIFNYQICNDVTKLCYPPQVSHVSLPTGSGPDTVRTLTEPNTLQPPTPWSLQEQITALFGRYFDSLFLTFLLVFAAGLLAVVTPCVYPMLPMTAAIFTARGESFAQRKQGHALLYFLGIICFYTCLGWIAALTGTALSAIMTNAWVHLGFAALFASLGLSMLGVYEFHFFARFMTKVDTVASHVGGYCGTFLMGVTTGLIVSPCVGPITSAILLDITGQAARTQALIETAFHGVVLRGTLLMTGFGLGLGFPFLLIGMLSSRLPSAGTWLTKTQYVLAIPTLYFAYTYYMKGMEIAAIAAPTAHIFLFSLGALGAASLLLYARPWPPRPLRYASSGLLLAIGLFCVYKAVMRPEFGESAGFLPRTPKDTPGLTSMVEVHANLSWQRDFILAKEQALAEHKPLFVDFYAHWCANCKAFQQLVASDTQLHIALRGAILVKIYDTDPSFRTFQNDPSYPELKGVGGQPLLPLFAIYSSQGILVWKGQDYQAVRTMIAQLDQAKRLASNIMTP